MLDGAFLRALLRPELQTPPNFDSIMASTKLLKLLTPVLYMIPLDHFIAQYSLPQLPYSRNKHNSPG